MSVCSEEQPHRAALDRPRPESCPPRGTEGAGEPELVDRERGGMNRNQHLNPESKGGGPVAWARGDAGTQPALRAGAPRRTLGDGHRTP